MWSDDPQCDAGTSLIFTGTDSSNWAWDDVAKAYYWHRFFSHQPDLNFDNPRVLKAVLRAMRFWLDMGIDGLRLDAIPYLCEREGTNNENLPETHAVIKAVRKVIDEHYGDRMLLAEANQWPEDVSDYFGDGDECHMAFHFPLMPRIYMAIAQQDRHPIVEIMQQTPEIPDNCQWAIFLRNHDELTLEMVTSKERDYMYRTYAADPRARINLGIRRRLAPLMENDTDRIRLMNSLLLSMPGSPILYYGDEIGMGDNIFLGDRNGVRTPMQWSPDRNAGFSRADPQRLYLPAIQDPIYGYEAVNVEAQARDPSSLLNWMKRLLAVRKTSGAFGRGKLSFLRPGNRKVLAYLRELGDEAILCVANVSRSAQPVELDLSRFRGRVPVELLGRTTFPPIGELPYLLTLPAHGFYWFRLATDAEVPSWHEEYVIREDLSVLVLFDGWNSFFRDHVVPWRIGMAQKVRDQFEHDVLPRYIEFQRWYAAKGESIAAATLTDHAFLKSGSRSWLMGLFNVASGKAHATYFMPMALAWEDAEEERVRELNIGAVAKARQQANVGVLADAMIDEAFCQALVEAIGAGTELASAHGTLRFTPTRAFRQLAGDQPGGLSLTQAAAQSSNSTAGLGDRLFIKAYRVVRPGVNPELEVGRFLTEVARFPNCVPVAGALEYVRKDGPVSTLALLQAYLPNQGDGWRYTLDYLEHFLEERRIAHAPAPEDVHGAYLELMRTLGQRTAQLHLALATPSGDPAFEPEKIERRDIAAWSRQVREEAVAALDLLAQRRDRLQGAALADAGALLERRERLLGRIEALPVGEVDAVKIRYHGDYHLGQVLLSNNDFVIIDFEGEPARSLDERRQKHSPLRDVAGMLRSFNYASSAALLRISTHRPDELDALQPLAAAWEQEVRGRFLQAYRDAAGSGTLYRSFDGMSGLLQLFELEKALYELRYELNNRPDWVRVPLRGILALAG